MGRAPARAVAALCLLVACATCKTDPERVVVAWLNDRPLTLAAWQRYLAVNLLEAAPGAGDDSGTEVGDRVRSRLFDAFVDEWLLVAEAERRGLDASDAEVEAWLADGPEGREDARRRIAIRKLEDDVAADLPADAGTTAEAAAGRDDGGRSVRLSSLRFEDAAAAEEVAAAIARGDTTFDEALIAWGSAPDGVPVEMAWSSLWEEHRASLDGLSVGQVSRPVEMAGEVWLFRVEAWLEGPAAGAAGEARVHHEIERARLETAFATLRVALRQKAALRIVSAALPFRYVAADGNS